MHKELEALVEAAGRYLAGEADSDIPLADALTAARQALVPVELKDGRCICGQWIEFIAGENISNYCPNCGQMIRKE